MLVKGLDMALLEQNKARVAQSTTEEDDALEQAFQEGSAVLAATMKKKSTREELLRKLKETRQQEQVPQQNSKGTFEDAKKAGKFKPIGFKAPGEEKIKKKKIKAQDGQDKKKKKKKRETEASPTNAVAQTEEANRTVTQPPPQPTPSSSRIDPQPEPDPDAEFDIFTGVGDYEGIDLSDENDETAEVSKDKDEASPVGDDKGVTKPNWFEEAADIPVREPTPPDEDIVKQATMRQKGDGDQSDEDRPQGLVPLASSAIPSIRDFLAVEGAADKSGKKRKRKEKTKAGGGGKKKSAEAKVEADYKRCGSSSDVLIVHSCMPVASSLTPSKRFETNVTYQTEFCLQYILVICPS